MSGEQGGQAPSTRWTARKKPSVARDKDEAAELGFLVVVGLLLACLVLPALLVAALSALVWKWRRWPAWWLAAGAVGVLPVGWLAGWRSPLEDVERAGRALIGGPSLETVAGVWASAWPALVAVGALGAAGWVGFRRLREPSWREQGPKPGRQLDRKVRAAVADLETRVTDEDGSVLLGVDEETGDTVGLPVARDGQHTLVVGSTGSGKTTTVTRMAVSVLEDGGGLVVVDLKGDKGAVQMWETVAASMGKRCVVWSFSAGSVYDPLVYGGVSERVRKVMALSDWTEPYYEDIAEQVLQLVIQVLDEVGDRPTLARLHNLLTLNGLRELGGRSGGPAGSKLADEVGSIATDKGRQSALASLRTKLALLVQAEYGPLLDPDEGDGRETVDITRALDEGDVVVVSLSQLRLGKVAARMAEVVLTDVASVAGTRQDRDLAGGETLRPGMLWVDEFSAMRPGPFASLFARVRSARIALVLSTQGMADLTREDPAFLDAVMDNVGSVIAHRVQTPASAEFVASLIGTVLGWQETSQVEALTRLDGDAGGATGLGTIRSVEKFVVHPNVIKWLPNHYAVVLVTTAAAAERARRIRVVRLRHPVPEPESAPPVVVDGAGAENADLPVEDVRPTEDDVTEHHPSASLPVDLPGDNW